MKRFVIGEFYLCLLDLILKVEKWSFVYKIKIFFFEYDI